MLLTVNEFRDRIETDLDGLVEELKSITGRYGEEEEKAWRASLPSIGFVFSSPSLSDFHLYFGNNGNLDLEYRLPAASSWCDIVLLGRNHRNKSAVIIELKNWLTRDDRPGEYEGLMLRQGRSAQHPSDQVRGYRDYCQRFHSAVLETNAEVHGCVFFTGDVIYSTYNLPPNKKLTSMYPCFSSILEEDISSRFPGFLGDRLNQADSEFAVAFEKGKYRQDRNFIVQVADLLLDKDTAPFELLDGQRTAYAECLGRAKKIIDAGLTKRHVIVVDGPPGSGKSIIAAKLWAELVKHPDIERRAKNNDNRGIVLATTSSSQNSNWEALIEKSTMPGGRGIVKKVNQYMPFTPQDIHKLNEEHPSLLGVPKDWKNNLSKIEEFFQPRIQNKDFLISIVDEAHALVNPENSDSRGMFGFAVAVGPQAYHVIKGSVVSIFFTDLKQSFREHETTTIEQLKAWAKELDADITEISLEGSQFRCGGSKEYVDWVEQLLDGDSEAARLSFPLWRDKFECRLFDSVLDLEETLEEKIANGAKARLVASYARPWRTKGINSPHDLPASAKDFHIENIGWSKIWNYLPKTNDYESFIQGPEGTIMNKDQLCEVGCAYVVRGFDFDYVGLLWFSDLIWRDGNWKIDLNAIHESGLKKHRKRAREEGFSGPETKALEDKIKQAYRILLTRAMKGVYIWFEDEETAQAVQRMLGE